MKITMTRDDVTGAELTESSEVKVTVGDVTGTLDLGPDSLAALTALARGEGTGKLTALLAPPASMVKRSGGRKSAGSRDGKPDPVTGASPEDIRAWAASQGIAVNARGRVPAEVREKFRVAHSGKPAPASAGSASDAAKTDAASTADASAGKTDTRK